MKKILILAALLPLTLCSCGKAENNADVTESVTSLTSVSETTTVSFSTQTSETTTQTEVVTSTLTDTIVEPVLNTKSSTTSVTATTAVTTTAAVTTTVTTTVKPVTTTTTAKPTAATKTPTTAVETSKSVTTTTTVTSKSKYEGKSAEEILKLMSVEEKVGQLFIVRPEALGGSASKFDSAKQSAIDKYHVGGVCMFSNNITTPKELTQYISSLQKASDVPLFISVDEEGGRVARIAKDPDFDVKKFPSMQEIGASGDPSKAYEVGKTIGSYLKKYGFNLDFAPVADVNTNPDNIVIGNRAFGSDPLLVSKLIQSSVKGFHSQGIMTCVKHFPGHGDTYGDTHKGTVSVTKSWEELKKCELIPFIAGISENTDMIMVAHINTPNVTTDGLPASLSKQMIQDKLRGELGYDGVVITDALEMKAIASKYGVEQSAVMIINAGADIILMPEDLGKAYNAVLKAVKSGEISQQRLDESVLRILNLKEKYGILT